MVLIVDDKRVEAFTSIDDLVTGNLRKVSRGFSSTAAVTVGRGEKCVYLGQQDMAVISKDDTEIDFVGSEDATTCHIVILRNQISGSYGFIHLDSGFEQLGELFSAMKEMDGQSSDICPDAPDIDVHIIGGFSDDQDLSQEISEDIFRNMIKWSTIRFHLKLYCSLDINTVVKDGIVWPKHYGAGLRIPSGEIFPAKFANHGPDKDIRSLRMYSGEKGVLLLYRSGRSSPARLCIPPFTYRTARRDQAAIWLTVPDEYMLSKCSTSPLVEPPHFCEDTRNSFRRMISDPDPLKTIFKDGRSREYEWSDVAGEWCLVNPELFGQGEGVQPAKPSFSVQDFYASVKKM